jgi:hypothetical protein
LQLKYNDTTYLNDVQSARRIKVYRRSSLEFVQASLFNKSHYQVSVNLEGPKTNQFRIYFQDYNGALYPLTVPDQINFVINTGGSGLLTSFEEYYYSKLGLPSYAVPQMLQQAVAFDPTKIKLVLIPNMVDQGGQLTYFIGNEFRTSVLVVDNQTSRCILESNYNPYKDLQAIIQRFDPATQLVSRISIDVEKITLVLKIISQATSYCTYYSIAVLESQDQLI